MIPGSIDRIERRREIVDWSILQIKENKSWLEHQNLCLTAEITAKQMLMMIYVHSYSIYIGP